MELVRDGSRQHIQKGFHLLNILGPKIISHILPCCDLLLTTLLDLVTDGNFLDVMCFSAVLLSTLTRNADLRKRFVFVAATLWGFWCCLHESEMLHCCYSFDCN